MFGLNTPRQHRSIRGDERGSTLLSVMIIMLILTMLGLTLTAVVGSTTTSVATNRDVINSQAAADAGLAEMVSLARQPSGVNCVATVNSATTPKYSGTATCNPTKGEVKFEVTGTSGKASTKVMAVYSYTASATTGSVTGALVTASSSSLNISSINVRNDGDFIIGGGNLDCNNSTTISGDLVLGNGSASLSNTCAIKGNIHATGDVRISNNNLISGNVVTLGEFYLNQGKVEGNASAIKGVTINNATVKGDVTSQSTGSSSVYMGTIGGSVRIAGTFSSFQSSTVGGNVLAAGTGNSSIAPDTTIQGNLQLGGDINTWNGGPTVKGTKAYKQTKLVAPTILIPDDLASDAFEWTDYSYKPELWSTYQKKSLTSSQCDWSEQPATVAMVNGYSTPTVLDARACKTLDLERSTLRLNTDVIIIGNAFDSSQSLSIYSGNGASHTFSLITPDNTADKKATCASGQGMTKIDDVYMAPEISGLAYSPCRIHLGQSGSTSSRWNGQIYTGQLTWGGNAGSAEKGMQLYYIPIPMPGVVVDDDPTPGAGRLGDLVERADV